MRVVTRNLARLALPQATYDAASFAARRLRKRGFSPTQALDHRFVDTFGPSVRGGPFRGLEYREEFLGHTTDIAAKLLGAYEQELHGAVEDLLARPFKTLVDIGCAEGYYAVGIALRRPDIRVVAHDIDPAARQMCRVLARHNGVSIDVRGAVSQAEVSALADGTVIFSDCEGAEIDLLDPSEAPVLARLPILVETHDFIRPGATEQLRARFSTTHHIREVHTGPRNPSSFQELAGFAPNEQAELLSEGRPAPMTWLVLEPCGTGP